MDLILEPMRERGPDSAMGTTNYVGTTFLARRITGMQEIFYI
jgi:hypothetical protein